MSGDPSMIHRLEQKPIYDRPPVGSRRGGRPLLFSSALQPLPVEWLEQPDTSAPIGGALCWSGWCPGCGRALVSAVTDSAAAPDRFYCSKECRP